MRFFLTLLPLAVLAALASAAPVDPNELVARAPPGGGGQYASWKRSCPNGSNSCSGYKREPEEARSCPNGKNGCE
ncbi:hypothetical protein L226DRAFT_527937 [Lentinus tigrinus ALCF2SS1-7]|uniref:uncharacterized protein n=1 Tax=Lentinus tigrinus ALCF2SS1-7 TaxID=1328758 RepID=UPI00116638BC|nr:hypothetical protein L226DRAFT_527937 [Lentinus tigrinus ALCF2SS1-7]